MSSLHATYHSPPHPRPTGGPAGGHQQADPDRQDRSRAMKDCSAHGGGSLGAPRTSPQSPRRRMRVRWRTRRGLSQLRRRPGGLEQSDLVGLGFFSSFFVLCFLAVLGRRRSWGHSHYDCASWSGSRKWVYRWKTKPCLLLARGSGDAAAMALRAAGSGIANTRIKTKQKKNRFVPHCRSRSRFWGAKPVPPSYPLPPGRAGRSAGSWGCRCRSVIVGLSVRLWTSSLLLLVCWRRL